MVLFARGHFEIFLGSFWDIFGLILIYVPIFLEKRSIFSHEILYRCLWYYSDGLCWGPFWCMILSFLKTVQYFFIKFCTDVFSITLGHLGYWGIFGPILVCYLLFLENHSILFYEILDRFLKTLWPLFMDGVQLSQGYRITTRRQVGFYH